MKYVSPLLLAYEDQINEKDALLQAVEVMRFSISAFVCLCLCL